MAAGSAGRDLQRKLISTTRSFVLDAGLSAGSVSGKLKNNPSLPNVFTQSGVLVADSN